MPEGHCGVTRDVGTRCQAKEVPPVMVRPRGIGHAKERRGCDVRTQVGIARQLAAPRCWLPSLTVAVAHAYADADPMSGTHAGCAAPPRSLVVIPNSMRWDWPWSSVSCSRELIKC
eukprot:2546318-Rhodomonas_salina.2